MSVLVRKSPCVLVMPLEPVSMSPTIKLSSFDKGLDKIEVAVLLMFQHPVHEVADTIKRALSQALVHYYPIAGRILAGSEDGEVHIQCNGEGVAFVSASTNCALKQVLVLDESNGTKALLHELAIFSPANGGSRASDPLLLMQVTEFSCGGFVLGVTWNHAIADGTGIAQFLQSMAELSCGLSSPSIVPLRWDDSVLCAPLSREPWPQLTTSLDSFDNFSGIEITIPSRLIKRIKAEFSSRFSGQLCTKFEVASAVLWQCRTRAIMSDPETPVSLLFSADVRKLVGAKQGYYGNCLTCQLVMATSGTVASGDIVDLVNMIKDSKAKIADIFKKNNEGSNPQQDECQVQKLPQHPYNMLIITSWVNLGFDEVDFGSGRPARVMPYGKETAIFPVCVMCPPWKTKDRVDALLSMFREEHVDTFLAELERLT
ncbi:unnamed protein product [Urochloa decumbens]|uniref:Uncharacterized protein n=1 Tax=Urochloa decumbens TaxID=240449 RepID=A0ABC9AKB9_9POAL